MNRRVKSVDQFEKEPKIIQQMIEQTAEQEMRKIEVNLTKIQTIENPLVIMLLQEKLRIDGIKADFMQKFSEKVLKIEQGSNCKNAQKFPRDQKCQELMN